MLPLPRQRGPLAALLERDAGVLLLAAAADSKVRAARLFALRAIAEAALNLSARELFLLLREGHFRLLIGQ